MLTAQGRCRVDALYLSGSGPERRQVPDIPPARHAPAPPRAVEPVPAGPVLHCAAQRDTVPVCPPVQGGVREAGERAGGGQAGLDRPSRHPTQHQRLPHVTRVQAAGLHNIQSGWDQTCVDLVLTSEIWSMKWSHSGNDIRAACESLRHVMVVSTMVSVRPSGSPSPISSEYQNPDLEPWTTHTLCRFIHC